MRTVFSILSIALTVHAPQGVRRQYYYDHSAQAKNCCGLQQGKSTLMVIGIYLITIATGDAP